MVRIEFATALTTVPASVVIPFEASLAGKLHV